MLRFADWNGHVLHSVEVAFKPLALIPLAVPIIKNRAMANESRFDTAHSEWVPWNVGQMPRDLF